MRSRILGLLSDDEWRLTSTISENVNITASTVLYHLRNMEHEDIVQRNTQGKGWKIKPTQQVELTEFLSKKQKR